ncbi:hypothetical protein [Acetivibrio straminisolvens]|jgi:hypothetical protein|uniref:Uncharacterized protein n=1 Tax=Acetivibrio straminisolvens JCM 21531 TaxID=1294263 RepID=W4VB03_9FIRM|nr:hypothetical protein [Acetivibrio straminisolvens]GAE90366.1 hypothetical protein JCM21531_3969 [Acetivibrio straminisolvens JCM 21531]
MANAYDILIKAGHDNIKDSVKESWSKFPQYAESEADVGVDVYASDVFGNEMGKHGETITYGTIASFQRNATLSRLYKKRTIEIFEYFTDLGIEVEFVF